MNYLYLLGRSLLSTADQIPVIISDPSGDWVAAFDWRNWNENLEYADDLRTIPYPDLNVLGLTPYDFAFLCEVGIRPELKPGKLGGCHCLSSYNDLDENDLDEQPQPGNGNAIAIEDIKFLHSCGIVPPWVPMRDPRSDCYYSVNPDDVEKAIGVGLRVV